MPSVSRTIPLLVLILALHSALPARSDDGPKVKAPVPPVQVSYDKVIRPLFQARCQGCHQPAKAGGGYVMTAFDRLLKGGESGLAGVVPGKPEESHVIEQITPSGGKAEMPRDQPPLPPAEIDLITRWIAQGAVDDTPKTAVAGPDADHPPVYTRPPVIPALAFAPDGQLLAVAGFHEILLWKADGSERVARLVGLSERIASLAFSPDGTRLAATGGLPARMGEVQVWDVARRKLLLSVPITPDTVYGASWSPDGTRLALGCADNSVRVIGAKTGEQVLFMGLHTDWVLDTVFSTDGSHLVSVGRDMAAKLTEVATQRFVDNITSITPGALKGGIRAVARHPKRDEVVIGGSDGVPKLYRIFRQTARVIGDDSNLIREFEPMRGRVNDVAISADGRRIAAVSSLDGVGEVHVYSYEFDTALPDRIKAIMAKVATTRSPEERAALEKYHKEGVRRIAKAELPQSAAHSVAFRPDGHVLAVAGGDGKVRLLSPKDGALIKEFSAAPLSAAGAAIAAAATGPSLALPEGPLETESLPAGATLVALEVQPRAIRLGNRLAYAQLLVTGRLEAGGHIDVTRMVEPRLSADVATVSRSGLVSAKADGQAMLRLDLAGQVAEVPVTVTGTGATVPIDFIRDVTPILSRLGCNAGTCHGSAQGKNGFKLSLRGYDPLFDVRALTDDFASRRVNPASPDDSLMLLKPTAAVPHVGGQLIRPGEPYYQAIRTWIADGARIHLATPRVARIELTPSNPVVERVGAKQQVRVLATYADGAVRDVTREAFVDSGAIEVAEAGRHGLITALRRGEAPLLARYEGAYAATTLTVMGDRTGFVWESPPTYGRIDELVAAKWQRMKIQPSALCSDADFLRRASLDLTGLPPTSEEVRAFLKDPRASRAKREALVDRLIGGKDFVEYWTNKWADLLQVNRKYLGVEGSVAFRKWIRDQVERNVPYDQFVRAILTASGSNRVNPAASYFKIHREPAAAMENTTHLFLGIRFNCNKCHDHPFERWTQDQYYQTAAFFAQVGLKADPACGDRKVGGSYVEEPKPLFEEVWDKSEGEVIHDRTKTAAAPRFPYPASLADDEKAPRRARLASWLTSRDNPYFARSYVNRLWGYLLGVGLIEPLDDIRAGNPPTNSELLEYLTDEFLKSGWDVRHVMRLICRSRTYQLSVASNRWNRDDQVNYSHAIARRLPAEVLYDAVNRVTGAVSKIPGVPRGTRAAELPDSGVDLPSGFFDLFGRPPRESACECERSSGLDVGPVIALVGGPTIGDAIADRDNELTKLVGREANDAKLIDELFVRVLNRPATPAEIEKCRKAFSAVDADHRRQAEALGRAEMEAALEAPQKERQRQAALAAARADLAAYEKEHAAQLAEAEARKAADIARLEAALKSYEAKLLASKAAEWESKDAIAVRWVPLPPKAMRASNGSTLIGQADGSIFVTGTNRNGVVTIEAETDLTDLTGIRLEVLPDDRLPGRGPGRAADGNFVLNELEVTAAPKGHAQDAKPVVLQNARADFSQPNLPAQKAIDGLRSDPNNGWGIAPANGIHHWATFETKEAVGGHGGTLLTFKMHHHTGELWTLGRFRFSVTRVARPVGLGLPEDFRAILAIAPELRTDAQREVLLGYLRKLDPGWREKVDDLGVRKALPIDAKRKELQDAVAAASRTPAPDPQLVQLRQDVAMSIQQAAARRLTAAQDIVWVLINSPAFLFNH